MEEVGQAGAILTLTGIPIVTPMTARWQLLTGAGPGKTGMDGLARCGGAGRDGAEGSTDAAATLA